MFGPTNKNCKNIKALDFLKLNIFILNFLGQFYLEDSNSFWIRFRNKFHKYLFFLMAFGMSIPGMIFYIILEARGIEQISGCLFLLLCEMSIWFKVFLLNRRKPQMLRLLKYMELEQFRPYVHEHEVIMKRYKRKAWACTGIYCVFSCFGIAATTLSPLMVEQRILPTTLSFPLIDVLSSPHYEIVYFLHIFYKPIIVLMYSSLESLPGNIMCIATSQIKILSYNLKHIDNTVDKALKEKHTKPNKRINKDDVTHDTLKSILQHHELILEFVKLIEEVFGIMIFLQLILSVYVICLTAIKLISIDPLSTPMEVMWTINLMLSTIVDTYTVCDCGNDIMDASTKLMDGAFSSPWINWSQKNKKTLILFMESSNKPVTVMAGIFMVSLKTFSALMKMSYNAFAVLNSVRSK